MKPPCERPSHGSQSTETWATRLSSPSNLYSNPPNRGSVLVKASRGGGPAQDTATTGPSTSATESPPKTEGKRQRKKKRTIPKCTVTSETIPSVEKKPKYSPSLLTLKLKVPSGTQIVPSVHPRAHLTCFNNKFYTPPCYILIKHDSNFPYVLLLAPLNLSALYIYWALNNFKTP